MKPITSIFVLTAALAGASHAATLFSVNLWSPGSNRADAYLQESWRDTVRVNGKEAGVWSTTVWDDINVFAYPALGTATINGSDSSTATFAVIEKRNQAETTSITAI